MLASGVITEITSDVVCEDCFSIYSTLQAGSMVHNGLRPPIREFGQTSRRGAHSQDTDDSPPPYLSDGDSLGFHPRAASGVLDQTDPMHRYPYERPRRTQATVDREIAAANDAFYANYSDGACAPAAYAAAPFSSSYGWDAGSTPSFDAPTQVKAGCPRYDDLAYATAMNAPPACNCWQCREAYPQPHRFGIQSRPSFPLFSPTSTMPQSAPPPHFHSEPTIPSVRPHPPTAASPPSHPSSTPLWPQKVAQPGFTPSASTTSPSIHSTAPPP